MAARSTLRAMRCSRSSTHPSGRTSVPDRPVRLVIGEAPQGGQARSPNLLRGMLMHVLGNGGWSSFEGELLYTLPGRASEAEQSRTGECGSITGSAPLRVSLVNGAPELWA